MTEPLETRLRNPPDGYLTEEALAALRVEAAARISELEREVASLKTDDPFWDGTDAAHQAWWRGHDAGCLSIIRDVTAILDGAPLRGTCQPVWQALRKRLAALRSDYQQLFAEHTNVTDALIRKCEEAARLREALQMIATLLTEERDDFIGANMRMSP